MEDPLALDVPTARAAEHDRTDWAASLAVVCPVCGFSAAGVPNGRITRALRAGVMGWQAVLTHPDVRERPREGVWSPLEYACHVRDLATVVAARVDLVLDTDHPIVEDWDEDIAALDGEYPRQDPTEVAADLDGVTALVTARLDEVHDDQWDRVARTTSGTPVTVRHLALYLVHDLTHHLVDVDA